MIDWEIFSFGAVVMGELLVATTALLVHENVQEYRKISKNKRRLLERERLYGWLGAALIAAGGIMHILIKLYQ